MLNPIISLFLVLAAGSLLGRISLKGISLGAGGVLFVALLAGHFGFSTPGEVGDVGIVLFMYAAGLRAGPRFFRSFKKRTVSYLILGAVPILIAVSLLTAALKYDYVNKWHAAGIFAASLTSTSALASALDAVQEDPGSVLARASEAYGLTYPFGLLATILFIKLIPFFSRQSVDQAQREWVNEHKQEEPDVEVAQYRITNPNCHGKLIKDLALRGRGDLTISRIDRGTQSMAGDPEISLQTGDVITLVGHRDSLSGLEILFGERVQVYIPMSNDVQSVDMELSEPKLTEGTLKELAVAKNYQVVVTRVRRQGIEFIATADSTLEVGDQIRIVGKPDAVSDFVKLAGAQAHLIDETSMVPFSVGILLGLLLGIVPISLFGLIDFSIGAAGGVFIIGLLAGHYGRFGPFRFYVPQAASNLCQELGVILFLANTGTMAGATLLDAMSSSGWNIVLCGVVITLSTLVSYLILAKFIFKLNILAQIGGASGLMTSGTGLATTRSITQSELPAITYAAVFPVALFTKIVLANILVRVL